MLWKTKNLHQQAMPAPVLDRIDSNVMGLILKFVSLLEQRSRAKSATVRQSRQKEARLNVSNKQYNLVGQSFNWF